MDKTNLLCYNDNELYEGEREFMRISFLPAMLTDSLTDLTPEQLLNRGIRLLMLDFDNTVVPYTTNTPTETMAAWLERFLSSEVQLCVVSNSRKDRVRVFCEERGLDCITRAKKPFSRGIRQCLQRYGCGPEAAALVGDQIYTDTLGANCAGVTSILVKAIDNHNFWLKLRHVAEKPFIYLARNRRIHHEES